MTETKATTETSSSETTLIPMFSKLRYLSNYDWSKLERKTVPEQPKSLRLTLKNSNLKFKVRGYSYSGVNRGEHHLDKFWIRLTSQPGKQVEYNLETCLENIDTAMKEIIAGVFMHVGDLPSWFKTDARFYALTGTTAADVVDEESSRLSYSFFIHNQYTKCYVRSDLTHNIEPISLTHLVKNSGNSWFNLEMGAKMIDFVFNEEKQQIDTTLYINLSRVILFDWGHVKTPLTELVDYKEIQEAKRLEELNSALDKDFYALRNYYPEASLNGGSYLSIQYQNDFPTYSGSSSSSSSSSNVSPFFVKGKRKMTVLEENV